MHYVQHILRYYNCAYEYSRSFHIHTNNVTVRPHTYDTAQYVVRMHKLKMKSQNSLQMNTVCTYYIRRYVCTCILYSSYVHVLYKRDTTLNPSP